METSGDFGPAICFQWWDENQIRLEIKWKCKHHTQSNILRTLVEKGKREMGRVS